MPASIFAVAFLSNVLVFDRNFDSPEKVADWLDNNLVLQYSGSIAIAVAGVAFLWFMAKVRLLVADVEAGDGPMASLMFGASVAFVALLWVATPVDVGIAEFVGSGIDLTTYEAVSNIAHQHLLYSQIAIAAALGVLFVIGRRTGWPRWAVWFTGFVALTSVGQLVLTALILLLPVWVFAFALAFDRRPAK